MSTMERFEYSPETEAFETDWHEAEHEPGVFSEAEALELAGRLTEVTTEAEFDHFLGDLISKAGKAIGKVVHSPIGKAVGGVLKGVAKTALPLAGTALGGMVGGPLGAQIGGGLASAAGGALGLESELGHEDREFEGARIFVKLAGDAVKLTVMAPLGTSPVTAARAAVDAAVQKHAPGLLHTGHGHTGHGHGHKSPRTGRWVRHGRNVIIVNCGG